MLVAPFYLQYMGLLAQLPLADSTKRAYASRVRNFLAFVSARSEFGPSDWQSTVDEYKNHLIESQTYCAGSINDCINAVEHFLSTCGYSIDPISRHVRVVREREILTADQYLRFLDAAWNCADKRNRALAMLIGLNGLRLGQCADLRIGDLLQSDAGLMIRLSGTKVLEVLSHPSTEAALYDWLSLRASILATCFHPVATEHVFISASGYALGLRGMDYAIRRLGWSARLDVCAEKLRRTFRANESRA